ncbi:hypothetical protein LINGRAHAP2_LOCUS17597 [Linum grandiflorum]
MAFSTTNVVTVVFFVLAIFATSNFNVSGDIDSDLDVVKGPNCSQNNITHSFFKATVPILLSKLVAETPKHKDNSTGGHSYTGKSDFGPKGEGCASCNKGKDQTRCAVCLADAMERLMDVCKGKSSGNVELKACQMSFKED